MKHHLIHLTILSFLCLKAFAADPMWIWKAGTIASEEANFKTTLTLKAKPAKAPLIITCDNSLNSASMVKKSPLLKIGRRQSGWMLQSSFRLERITCS